MLDQNKIQSENDDYIEYFRELMKNLSEIEPDGMEKALIWFQGYVAAKSYDQKDEIKAG